MDIYQSTREFIQKLRESSYHYKIEETTFGFWLSVAYRENDKLALDYIDNMGFSTELYRYITYDGSSITVGSDKDKQEYIILYFMESSEEWRGFDIKKMEYYK